MRYEPITEKKEIEKYKPVAAGIVIDVSLSNLAAIKKTIINMIHKLGTQFYTEDRIYVHHPELNRIPTTKGSQIASAFYFYPVENHNIELSLKQTTYLIGYEEPDMRKHIILVTDQYDPQKENRYKKALYLNLKERFFCNFHFIGIGEQPFHSFEEFPEVEFLCIEDTSKLEEVFTERFTHETQNRPIVNNSVINPSS